jgi:hypothetical protein
VGAPEREAQIGAGGAFVLDYYTSV